MSKLERVLFLRSFIEEKETEKNELERIRNN